MKFKKVYIEITNICNFACSFCFKSNRNKIFVSPENFSAILFSIKPYTDYIYLHVLGEPLMHPQLDKLLTLAENQGFHVNMTTNGSLLTKRGELLQQHTIRQYNISLHDAEENIQSDHWKDYLLNVVQFADKVHDKSYVSLRLWNEGSPTSMIYNDFCRNFLQNYYSCDIPEIGRNIRLSDHVFLQSSARFTWPGEKKINLQKKTCYALRDHIAILVDGTVVPCCLDADASMALGNIYTENLDDILKKEKAVRIRQGFFNHQIVEPICRDCGFVLP